MDSRMDNFWVAVSNAFQRAPVRRLMSDYCNAMSSVLQSATSTLNASTAAIRTASTSVATDSTSPGASRCSSLTPNLQCMIIGSFGDTHAEGIKCSPKDKRPLEGAGPVTHDFLPGVKEDTLRLQDMIRKDKNKELVCTLTDYPQESKRFYLDRIEKLFKECSKDGALIYYTGHGEVGTGNWCFKDGTISFQEIISLYFDYFRGKLLYIFTDCCYSGQWVVKLAKYLDDLGIGACGHQAREQGILFKIAASCEPDQKAADGCFSKHSIRFDEVDGNITFSTCGKLSETQTAYGCDFTQIMCYQLQGSKAPCRIPNIPAKYQWQWQDVVTSEFMPGARTFLVRGKDRGRNAWHYVLVPEELVALFKAQVATGTIDVAIFGHVVCSAFGDEPSDEIKQKMRKFSPGYY